MPSLYVSLLGNPKIVSNDTEVEPATTKAVALLAYLAVVGGRHSRDSLSTFLWPELDNRRGHAALRTTLWRLNQALPYRLDADYYAVSIVETDVWVDVREFERLLRRSREHVHARDSFCSLDYPGSRQRSSICCRECLPWLKEAVSYYTGGFLEGFSLKDSLSFDEWQRSVSERLDYGFSDALERLVAGKAGIGELDQAIEYAQRWLSMDKYNEEGLRQIMWLNYLNGSRFDAYRYYQDFVENFRKDAGYEVERSTARLYQLIRTGYAPTSKRTGRIGELNSAWDPTDNVPGGGARVYNSQSDENAPQDDQNEKQDELDW